jgi:hypothetical protein
MCDAQDADRNDKSGGESYWLLKLTTANNMPRYSNWFTSTTEIRPTREQPGDIRFYRACIKRKKGK